MNVELLPFFYSMRELFVVTESSLFMVIKIRLLPVFCHMLYVRMLLINLTYSARKNLLPLYQATGLHFHIFVHLSFKSCFSSQSLCHRLTRSLHLWLEQSMGTYEASE